MSERQGMGLLPPTVQCRGRTEEKASAWVSSPGYSLSPGIATTAPPGPGAGRGRRCDEPGGVRDAGILKVKRQGRERLRKGRLRPSLRVIIGVTSHASKSLKIR